MSQAMRKLTSNAAKAGCTIIFLNQLRQKVGVIYGNPEVTSGGQALKYYASVRVDVRNKGKIPGPKGEDIGIKVKAKVRTKGQAGGWIPLQLQWNVLLRCIAQVFWGGVL